MQVRHLQKYKLFCGVALCAMAVNALAPVAAAPVEKGTKDPSGNKRAIWRIGIR